ncbi:DUF3103 family protein [Streptomyces sp. NPDC058701]|uniref:DUF3103 family protein n=1 Tax=Streptomyces sp. NPDC058701 TaxID=3346608 RepID=UPI00365B04A8
MALQPAMAASIPTDPDNTVMDVKTSLTARLAVSLRDPLWNTEVRRAFSTSSDVDLVLKTAGSATTVGRNLNSYVTSRNERLLQLKGLPAGQSLLRLRLLRPEMATAYQSGTAPLIMAEAPDDVTSLTALRTDGSTVTLSKTSFNPNQPVLVVTYDGARAVELGMSVMEQTMRALGVASGASSTTIANDADAAVRIKTAHGMSVDGGPGLSVNGGSLQEPWWKGDAEVFGVLGGVGTNTDPNCATKGTCPDGQPRINNIPMPFWKKNSVFYAPNQAIWTTDQFQMDNNGLDLKDLVILEEDDGTSYKELAKSTAAIALSKFGQGNYAPIANTIISNIPDNAFSDDTDTLDTYSAIANGTPGDSAVVGTQGELAMNIKVDGSAPSS